MAPGSRGRLSTYDSSGHFLHFTYMLGVEFSPAIESVRFVPRICLQFRCCHRSLPSLSLAMCYHPVNNSSRCRPLFAFAVLGLQSG